jgi:2-dehydro-3-deoxyphosphogluconate aldolase / (4S)-4-hydroxy-2-oxoglutarate aldolase
MTASSSRLDESSGPGPDKGLGFVGLLRRHRVVAVVRALGIPDAADLCAALQAGGIGLVELTFTTPDLARHLRAASAYAASTTPSGDAAVLVGVGTVTGVEQARVAIDAGAAFLVTPGLGPFVPEVVDLAHAAGVPVLLGALTPSEVLAATGYGADAVKVFPASLGGPRLLADLRGPFPDVPFVPSGGVSAENAQAFLDAGAVAVSAGSSVVSPDAVASGDWAAITASARDFRACLGPAAGA